MGMRVGVIGAGSFGTCLAMLAARENEVTLWARDPEVAASINQNRHNPRYLSNIELPDSIRATGNLEEALQQRELVIWAVPSHGLRDVLRSANPYLPQDAISVSTIKGIEVESGMRMDEVFCQELSAGHHPRLVFLSGPSFAKEIAERRPTVVTLACREEAYAISVQTTLSCPWFRCYSTTDVVGVEIGGALKNVIAIAVGICDGMGVGHNARAATMTQWAC